MKIILKQPQLSASLILSLFLGACGDTDVITDAPVESSSQSIEAAPIAVLSGSLFKGPVSGAVCDVYVVGDSGLKEQNLGSATTIEGSFEYEEPIDYQGRVLVECTGGDYTDEATGETLQAPFARSIFSVGEEEEVYVVITPLTEIAVQMAELASDNFGMDYFYQQVAEAFGIPQVDIISIRPANLFTEIADDSPEGQYAIVLAALSQLSSDSEQDIDALIGILAENLEDGEFSEDIRQSLSQAIENLGDSEVAGNLLGSALDILISNLDIETATVEESREVEDIANGGGEEGDPLEENSPESNTAVGGVDTDSDGQLDTDELNCGSDPEDAASAAADADQDGLPDCIDSDDGSNDAFSSTWNKDANLAISSPEDIHTYETGLADDGDWLVGLVEPETGVNMIASDQFARDGNLSLRTQFSYGQESEEGQRAEANQHYLRSETGEGDESYVPIIERNLKRFYGWSMLLDPTNFNEDSKSEVLWQSKHGGLNGVSGDATFQLQAHNGEFKVWYYSEGMEERLLEYIGHVYELGVWYDFVLEYYPTYDSNDGELVFYYKKASESDYVEGFSWTGTPTLLEDQDGYTKWGIYKNPWADGPSDVDTRVVFHDNIKYGLTFADADPSLVPPLPVESMELSEQLSGDKRQVTLAWQAPNEADYIGYNVYRASEYAGDYQKIVANTPSNQYIETLDLSEIYYYLVTVTDSSGMESLPSPIMSFEGVEFTSTDIVVSQIEPINIRTGTNRSIEPLDTGDIAESTQLNGSIEGQAQASFVSSEATIPVIPDSDSIIYTKPETETYSVTLSGLEAVGYFDIEIRFDLKISTYEGDGILVYRNNPGWVVDKNNDGNADSNEFRSFNADETLQFSVENLSISNIGLGVEFVGFTSASFAVEGEGYFDLDLGTATGYGTGYSEAALYSLDLQFTVSRESH